MLFKSKTDHRSNRRKDRRSKRLFTKLTALVTSLTLSLSLLPTTALASRVTDGQNSNGGMGDGEYNVPYIIHAPNNAANAENLSWKVDAYVSTNPTGKIDPEHDYIDSDYLKWVGGVLYDNFRHGNNDAYSVYIQADHTANLRTALSSGKATGWSNGFPSGMPSYYLPHLVQVKQNDKTYTLAASSGSREIAHVSTNPLSLPENAYDMEHCNYEKDVKEKFEEQEWVTRILNDINLSLGGNNTDMTPLYQAVINKGLGTQVIEKLSATKAETGSTDYSRLLPNSVDPTTNQPNCIVQWCLIVTPMYNFADAASSGITFWEGIDAESNEFTLYGLTSSYNWIGLDAYGIAQYNATSKVLYKNTTYRNYLNSFKGGLLPSSAKYIGYPQLYDAAAFDSWSGAGKLKAEIGSVAMDVANAMFDTHEGSIYCGIPTHKEGDGVVNATLRDNPARYAKFGIAAYLSKFTDPGIPVYYYVYDPDHPDAEPEVTTPFYYTPKDGTATFTPSTETGLPADCTVVAMESD